MERKPQLSRIMAQNPANTSDMHPFSGYMSDRMKMNVQVKSCQSLVNCVSQLSLHYKEKCIFSPNITRSQYLLRGSSHILSCHQLFLLQVLARIIRFAWTINKTVYPTLDVTATIDFSAILILLAPLRSELFQKSFLGNLEKANTKHRNR